MSFLTLDLETMGTKTHKRFANALCGTNYIVAVAYKHKGQEARVDYNATGISPDDAFNNIDLSKVKVIIAHNAKFDLLYLWKSKKLQKWLRAGGRVFDSMVCEYLLLGQDCKHVPGRAGKLSLDSVSLKYKGTLKNEDVKDVWANGGSVLDIDKDTLIEYAKYDVINTEIVAKAQLKQVKKLGMDALVKVHNDHLLATVEMEYNGMHFNVKSALDKAEKMEGKLRDLETCLDGTIGANELWPCSMLDFNRASTKHLAVLFFGGSMEITEKVDVLDDDGKPYLYKSGKRKGEVKQVNQRRDIMIPGLNETYLDKWSTDKGGRGVGEDVLQELQHLTSNTITKEIIEILLEHRKYSKLLSTYLYKKKGKTESGFVPLVHPDGCIHSEYQTTYTETGRLSSRNPNLQNAPPAIAELFESRYDTGKLVEADFCQLEIVIQAYITQCKKMIEDIEKGIDFHVLRLSYAEGMDYDEVHKLCQESDEWKAKRKAAKVISFQRAYGASPKKIAESTGLPESTIERVFEKENERYPEVASFYEDIISHLESSKRQTHMPLEVRVNGIYKRHPLLKQEVSKWQSLTGKIYTFYKKAVKTKKGIFHYWPAPNIQNYPVQGTAADIVAMQVGKVFRYMINNREKGLMVNEIHDSCVLDVKDEYVDEIAAEVKKILEDVKGTFEEKFSLTFNAPISVDVGCGKNWKEAK